MKNRTFFVITLGRVLYIAISLVAVRVYTSMLSTGEVGNFYLINSITAFFGFSLLNPVGMYINRKLHRWTDEKNLINAFFIYNLYLMAVSLASLVMVYFFNRMLGVGNTVDLKLLLLFVMLNIYFNTWNQTIIQTLNLLDHRITFAVFTVLTSALGLGLSTLLVKGTATAVWWLAGQLAAQMLVALVAFVFLSRGLNSTLNLGYFRSVLTRDNLRNVLCFVAPLSFTTFLTWSQSQSYRLIVENRIGLEFLGQIGLGLSIAANIAAAVESVVQQVYMPMFYREITGADQTGRTRACNRLFHLAIPIYFSLALFVSCLAPFLVTLLAHGKFAGAFVFVIYGAWIELFRMMTGLLSTTAHSEMQTRSLVKPSLAAALAVVPGVYLAAGTAYYQQLVPSVLTLSGMLGMFVMYLDMKKIMRLKLGIRGIVKSALVSTPFGLAALLYDQSHRIGIAFVTVLALGSYFLLSQYLLYRNGSASALSGAQAPT